METLIIKSDYTDNGDLKFCGSNECDLFIKRLLLDIHIFYMLLSFKQIIDRRNLNSYGCI